MRASVGMALGRVGELGNFIRDQRRNARLSLRKLSNMAGVSNPYLSQIERGLRRPSADILQAIAKALRISAETLYVKAGILEERPDVSSDPVAALLRDLTITDKQKQVLIEIYQSFRHENELEGTGRVHKAAVARRAVAAGSGKGARRPARTRPAPRPAGRAARVAGPAKSPKRTKAAKTKKTVKAPKAARARGGSRRRARA